MHTCIQFTTIARITSKLINNCDIKLLLNKSVVFMQYAAPLNAVKVSILNVNELLNESRKEKKIANMLKASSS